MSIGDKTTRRLGREVLKVYQELDPVFQKRAADGPATCQKGCAGCCYLLAYTTLPEALVVMEYLFREHSLILASIEKKLWAQVESLQKTMADRAAYFERKTPCALLTAENTCLVYPVRPSTCRGYMVTSDPAQCSPDKPGAEIARIDQTDLDVYLILNLNRAVVRDAVPLGMAPFPIAMLWALRWLRGGKEKLDKSLRRSDLGIMSFDFWGRLFNQGQQLPATQEILVQEAMGQAPTYERPGYEGPKISDPPATDVTSSPDVPSALLPDRPAEP